MTIIIKDVPGLTQRETLRALKDITGTSIATGHGGFVVSEDVADQFLSAYLVATGQRPAPVPVTEPITTPDPEPEPEPLPKRRPTRRSGGRRKEVEPQ